MLSAAEIASITTTVGQALDITLALYRNAAGTDTYGHATENEVSQGNVTVNIYKPSASQLSLYAALIGSKRAVMLRFLPTTDIRQGDRLVYQGKNWLVQEILNAESYTIATDALMTVIV
jgi:hypothetical protein